MPVLLPLIVMLASAVPPAHPEVTVAFRHAASAGNLRPLVPIVESEQVLFSPSFRGVRELLERYDCITIESIRATDGADNHALILDLDGSGITRNEARERLPIPARWYVMLSIDGSDVVGIEDETTRAARLLLEAGSDDERVSVVEASIATLPLMARLVADDASEGTSARAGAAAEFLLDWSRTRDDAETESYALATLAHLQHKAGQSEAAMRLANGARGAASRSASCDAAAYADLIAGIVQTDLGRARSFLHSAGGARHVVRDPRPSHRALYLEFRNHLEELDMPGCRATLDALELSGRRYGDREAVAWAGYGTGVLTATLGEARAHDIVFRIADGARVMMIHPLVEATALAMVAVLTPEDAIAFERFARAEKVVPAGATALRAYLFTMIGQRLTEAGRLEEAAASLKQALETAESAEGRPYILNAVLAAMVHRRAQGHYPEAIELGRRGIELDPHNLWVVWAIADNLGQMQLDCADYDGGIETLRKAIDLIEARRPLTTSNALLRVRHFASRSDSYRALIQGLVRERRFEEALITTERLKARSLEDSLAGIGTRLPLTAAESVKERALEEAVVRRNRELLATPSGRENDARQRLAVARAELEAFHADVGLRHATSDSAPLPDILDVAARMRTPVVEYAVGLDSVMAFVIRDGSVDVRVLATSPETMKRHAQQFLRQLERRDLAWASMGRLLYDELVAPIEDLLPRTGSLTVVADLFLWQVPFNALVDPERRFFGDRYAISYAPSLGLLDGAERRGDRVSPRDRTLLAVGDPMLGAKARPPSMDRGSTLGALPDAVREVRALRDLYTPEHSTILTGASARESVFKKVVGRYRIIHLATHGLVDDASPLYSALLLGSSRGDPEDGLLEMREIRRLRLNADLVVLSGCDTARGEIYSGEGVVGLSWAFLMAGCPQTVVSRWRVDSKATADLMIMFHKHLRSGNSTAEALRRAQLDLRKNPRYRQPFYWAPFLVVGSP